MINHSKLPDPAVITPVANFDSLVRAITLAHDSLLMKAMKAVNVSLTLRNWLIGFYIAVYEQQGADRATYGEHLLEKLAKRLEESGLKNSSERELRRYRRFYQIYPQIRETVSPEFRLHLAVEKNAEIRGMALPELRIDAKTMIERLSYSHINCPFPIKRRCAGSSRCRWKKSLGQRPAHRRRVIEHHQYIIFWRRAALIDSGLLSPSPAFRAGR